MKPRAPLLLLTLAIGCVSTLEQGEERYRQGDRRAALDVWHTVGVDDREHSSVADRIAAVKEELDRLVVAYVESAAILESEGRLAESILDYRLGLELEPDDSETLALVQGLARELSSRKAILQTEYEADLEHGDLDAANESLARLRRLDPFDPMYETEERQLQAALRVEWRRREVRIRAQFAGEVESLLEAGRDAFGNEKLDSALDLWRRALLIDPNNERIRAYISRAERQLKNLEKLRAEPDREIERP